MTSLTLDPVLGSVETAWDAGAMRSLLRVHAPIHHGSTLSRVVVDRIRHRIARRCIVQYHLTFNSEGLTDEVWVAGVAHADRSSSDMVRKLEKQVVVDAPRPMLNPVFHIPDLNMVFLVFPFDRRLPDLAIIGTEGGRAALHRWLGMDGDMALTPVRHRLGLSASVLASGSSRCFVKFQPAGEARTTVAATNRVAEVLDGRVDMALPRLLTPGRDITVTNAVDGRSLDVMDATGLADVLGDVATDLGAIHSADPAGLPDRRDVAHARADRAAEWLEQVVPAARTLIGEVRRAGSLVTSEATPVHGDMKPDHVIVSSRGRVFIDLDSAGAGRPTSDLASLATRLPDWAARELLAHYRAARPSMSLDGWAADWALAGLRYALFHAQHRGPGWQTHMIDSLEAALRPPRV